MCVVTMQFIFALSEILPITKLKMMTTNIANKTAATLVQLHDDSKNDHFKMMKSFAKSIFRLIQPSDFENAYLAISREQGESLVKLILDNELKNVVEFGTSFGISTLYLAQAVAKTGGHIVTTELLESKALKAIENFKRAEVNDLIEVRIGNAMETLKGYNKPIDLLFLDGWKDLYLPLFNLLEPNYHSGTIVYVDNADMGDSRAFLSIVQHNPSYQIESIHGGKAALIRVK